MATEALTLPVFDTSFGTLIGETRVMPDVQHGFILRELDDAVEEHSDIHAAHSGSAEQLLALSGVGQQWRFVHELKTVYSYSPRHVDGLDAQYYQVNTLHERNDGGRASFTLEAYDLGRHEHRLLQAKHAQGLGYSSFNIVPSKYIDELYLCVPSIWRKDTPRPPDAVVHVEVSPGQTLVFPNGYNATVTGEPGRLWFHTVHTVSDADEAEERDVSLGRLELVS